MKLYTFKNKNTGRIKSVKAFYYFEALDKCKSSNGWELMGFENL